MTLPIVECEFLGEPDPAARDRFHACAMGWVRDVGDGEHQLLQCDVARDRHRLIATYYNDQLARAACGQIGDALKLALREDALARTLVAAGLRLRPPVRPA